MNILLIGGTGFVGSAVARQLAAAGHVLRLPTRHRDRVKHLSTLPTADIIEADVHDRPTLRQLMHGQDAVISLVGILRGNFVRAHTELPTKIAETAKAAGVNRIIHISALGAAADAPSAYLRSKAAGEAALAASGLNVTVLQPSVIFGEGDHFLTLFAHLQQFIPILPLACSSAKFQPVWVEDVANTVVACLNNHISIGQTYQLGGPEVYSLGELVKLAGKATGHSSYIFGLPAALSYLQALVMECIPGAPMTRDNYYSMQVPNVCATSAPLPLNLTATALESIAPVYLRDGRWRASNDHFREHAGR